MSVTTHNPALGHTDKLDKMDDVPTQTMKRRMTLPTEPKRTDAIYKPAEKPCEIPSHGAAFILIHGLGDSAEGLEGIPLMSRFMSISSC